MKTTKLRQLLNDAKVTRIVGAHNAVSAELIEKYKYDAIWASGFEISAAAGVPDANIITLTELTNTVRIISEAVSIPVLVDCDSGFGNSQNVISAVKLLEKAGAAGICIEDKSFPKVNSYINLRQNLVETTEFC